MNPSLFHKIVIMIIFSLRRNLYFDLPTEYEKVFNDWLDEEIGKADRCLMGTVTIQRQDINLKKRTMRFVYIGEDAHDGSTCEGAINTNFDGKVKSIETW